MSVPDMHRPSEPIPQNLASLNQSAKPATLSAMEKQVASKANLGATNSISTPRASVLSSLAKFATGSAILIGLGAVSPFLLGTAALGAVAGTLNALPIMLAGNETKTESFRKILVSVSVASAGVLGASQGAQLGCVGLRCFRAAIDGKEWNYITKMDNNEKEVLKFFAAGDLNKDKKR